MKNIIFLLSLCFASQTVSASIYVSPNGNDNNIGSINEPLATVQKAIEFCRQSSDKQIVVTDGKYFNTSLHIAPCDSGLTIVGNTKNNAILYGGMHIVNWIEEGGNFIAQLPRNIDKVRALEINGCRRECSRMPATGAFKHANVWKANWVSSEANGWDVEPTERDLTTLNYTNDSIDKWINPASSELVVFHEWDESQVGVKSIDTIINEVTFSIPATHPAGAFADRNKNASTFAIINVKEALRPGNWYFNVTLSKLYYCPLANEKIKDIVAVAACNTHVVVIDKGSKNISFRNITFAVANAPLINPGYAAFNVPAAFDANEIDGLTLQNVEIKNSAGWGIRVKGKNIALKCCVIQNLGGGGIAYIGSNVTIDSCEIHDLGKIYNGAVGIIGNGQNNRISHCDIYNIPYCGINGFGGNSEVSDNLIYNVKTFMQDGGAIYMGEDSLSVMRHNAIISDYKKNLYVYALYFDEQARNCLAEDNLVLHTIKPIQVHMARNITYKNNIFIDNGQMILPFANSSELIFKKNIIIADKMKFTGPKEGVPNETGFDNSKVHPVMQKYTYATGIRTFNANVLFALKGEILHQQEIQYTTAHVVDFKPEGNGYCDPMFVNEANANFLFKPNSPALKYDIKPLNFDNVGCTGSFKNIYRKYR